MCQREREALREGGGVYRRRVHRPYSPNPHPHAHTPGPSHPTTKKNILSNPTPKAGRHTTHLKRDTLEPVHLRGTPLDGLPAGDAAGEGHEVDGGVLDGVCGELRGEVEDLDRGGGHAGAREGRGEAFGRQRGLRAWFEDDGVAGDERGEDGVDGDEVRVASE